MRLRASSAATAVPRRLRHGDTKGRETSRGDTPSHKEAAEPCWRRSMRQLRSLFLGVMLVGIISPVAVAQGIPERVKKLEEDVGKLQTRVNELEKLYGRVNELEKLYARVSELEKLN